MGIFKPPFPQLQRGSRFADRLAAAYMFCEGSGPKAYDSSGRSNGTYDLTLQSTASWNGGGETGNALNLNGTSDYAVDSATHDSLAVDFTIAALFRLNSGFTNGDICIANFHSNDRYLGVSGSKLQVFNGPSFPTGATTLVANKWYLGIGSVKGTNLRLWLNGKSDLNSTGSASTASNTTSHFSVGQFYKAIASGRFYPGLIGMVLAWNRPFSDDDAKALTQQYGPAS